MKQYKDELLASCLTFVLSLPHDIVALDIKAYIPALQVCTSKKRFKATISFSFCNLIQNQMVQFTLFNTSLIIAHTLYSSALAGGGRVWAARPIKTRDQTVLCLCVVFFFFDASVQGRLRVKHKSMFVQEVFELSALQVLFGTCRLLSQ